MDSRFRLSHFISSRPVTAAAVILVLAALAAYHNSFSGPYIFDDMASIHDNPSILHLWPLENVLRPAHDQGETVGGRPLVNLSLALNYAIDGYKVRGYHAVNLLIHILAGLTLFGIIRRTLLQPVLRDSFGPSSLPLALVIALLWIAHPLQTETVTYIIQRAESIMALFYLLTLYAFIRATESKTSPRWLMLSIAACFLGMASKEVMVSAPLMVLLYDRTFVAGSFAQACRLRWRYYIGLAASWVLLALVMLDSGTRGNTVASVAGVTPWIYALSECHAITHYLFLSFWPHPLILDYGPQWVSTVGDTLPYSLVVVFLLASMLVVLRHAPTPICRWPALGFLGCWFFLILAPSSSIVPIQDTLFEHRMYLPLAAVLTLAVLGLNAWLGRRSLLVVVGVATVFIGLTILRNDQYSDDLTLWTLNTAERPDNPRAHYNLATSLASRHRFAEAVDQFNACLSLKPDVAAAHCNLGSTLTLMGRNEEAQEQLELALKYKPNYAVAHYDLAIVQGKTGQIAEALGHYEQALKIRPDYVPALCDKGVLLATMGRFSEAIDLFQAALKIDPTYTKAQQNLELLKKITQPAPVEN